MQILVSVMYILYAYLHFSSSLYSYKTNNYSQIIESKSNKYEIAIFSKCFANDVQPIIIIGYKSEYKNHLLFQSPYKLVRLLRIDETDNLKNYTTKVKIYKIDTETKLFPTTKFIIEALNSDVLKLILYKLKNSAFWNIYGFFLIKNLQTVDSCKTVYSLVDIVWKFNILKAIFICHHKNDEIDLYTFNPYGTITSKFWKKIARYTQENGHPLILYKNFDEITDNSPTMCEAFMFDKTRDLSNYPIQIAGSTYKWIEVEDINGNIFLRDPFQTNKQIINILWNIIRAKTNYTILPLKNIGEINSNGIATGITADVLQGKYECRDIEDFQRGLWKYELNLHTQMGLCYITKKVSRSIIDQLSDILTLKLNVILLFCFLTITCLLAHLLRATYIEIALDILVAVAGLPMIRQPNTESKKVPFIWFVFSFMILSTYLQSFLSSILSSPQVYKRNVRDAAELISNHYKVYSLLYYNQFFYNTCLEGKILKANNIMHCLNLARADNKICCIEACRTIKYYVNSADKLYVSSNDIFNKGTVMIFREDSPLFKRITMNYNRLFETGIIKFIYSFEEFHYKKQSVEVFKNISVDQLEYSFLLLIYSCVISIVVFFIELLIKTFILNNKHKILQYSFKYNRHMHDRK